MTTKKFLSMALLIVAALSLSACTVNLGLGGKSSSPDGGVYKTANRGETWLQKSLIPTTSGQPNVINDLDANLLVIDPSDTKALYFASLDNGIFYSYDAAESWLPIKSLGPVSAQALAVDPASKCTLYAAIANKVQKSSDCGRTWQQVYYDNEVEVQVPTITVDSYDSHNVYIGTTRGEIIVSNDFGKSWRVLQRFDNEVRKIALAPNDSRIIMVATKDKGLFRSMDKGAHWEALSERLKDFENSSRFRDIALSKAQPGFMIYATNYGLLKTVNYGDDWTAIKLITPEKEATINAVVSGTQNVKEIYYITDTTFYGTTDGGANWSSKKLPSTRAGRVLVEDPNQAGLMYLGLKFIE